MQRTHDLSHCRVDCRYPPPLLLQIDLHVRACVRACIRACVRAFVRACMHVDVQARAVVCVQVDEHAGGALAHALA